MSNIAQYFPAGDHVRVETLRFEVKSIATALCRSSSEIVPWTEKMGSASRASLTVVPFHWLYVRTPTLSFQGGLQGPEDLCMVTDTYH